MATCRRGQRFGINTSSSCVTPRSSSIDDSSIPDPSRRSIRRLCFVGWPSRVPDFEDHDDRRVTSLSRRLDRAAFTRAWMLEGRSAPARSGLAAGWSPLPVRRPVVVRRVSSVRALCRASAPVVAVLPPGEVVSGRRSGRAGRACGWGGGGHPCRFPFGEPARRSAVAGRVVVPAIRHPFDRVGRAFDGDAARRFWAVCFWRGGGGGELSRRRGRSSRAVVVEPTHGKRRRGTTQTRSKDPADGSERERRSVISMVLSVVTSSSECSKVATQRRASVLSLRKVRRSVAICRLAPWREIRPAWATPCTRCVTVLLDSSAPLVSTFLEELVGRGEEESVRDPGDTSWISSTLHPVDGPLISDHEVSRHLELSARPIDVGALRSSGSADDEMSVADAARALRITPRYVRRLCAGFEDAGSVRQNRATLASRRDSSGAFRIRRGDLADFAESRRVPVARVGFDVTLTVEKSIGIVTMLSTGERQDRLVGAFAAANDTAISYLDRHASVARRKGAVVDSEGLLVASYLHGTSRRSTRTRMSTTSWRTRSSTTKEGSERSMPVRCIATLPRQRPSRPRQFVGRPGTWAWRGGSDPTASGRSPGLMRRASESSRSVAPRWTKSAKRSKSGGAADLASRGRAPIALSTRADKQAVDPIALRKEWLSRADRVGLDVGSCFDRADRARRSSIFPTGWWSSCSTIWSTRTRGCARRRTRSIVAM